MMISPCLGKFRPLFTIVVIVKLVSSNPIGYIKLCTLPNTLILLILFLTISKSEIVKTGARKKRLSKMITLSLD